MAGPAPAVAHSTLCFALARFPASDSCLLLAAQLYRFNDELGREIEKMESDIQKIREEKAVLVGGEGDKMESNRLTALRDLQSKLERAGAKTKFFRDKHSATLDVVSGEKIHDSLRVLRFFIFFWRFLTTHSSS